MQDNQIQDKQIQDSQMQSTETVTNDQGKIVKLGNVEFPERKVWIKTYGCQMNYHDSERILSHLDKLNFTKTDNQADADLVLFNTCAIRDLANQKFYSHVGETKRLKEKNKPTFKPGVKIGVGGCIAQTDGKDLIKKYKQLDFAFGTDVIDSIGEFVYRTYAGDDKFHVNTWDKTSDYSIETKVTHGNPQAFVNIIKGCDKFCSYCIVPFTRGREKSRKMAEVVKDISRLVEHSGVQEVTLLGQNVNSYGKENGESLAELIMQLEEIEGLRLIRYTTSHPYDVSDELIAVHAKSKKLANHLHLAVQSGSNTVLQRMLREYTKEHYLNLLAKLRLANPEIVITTDIIAGFPNETEQEHRETLDLLDKAQFDSIYSYNYSSRKGTKSSRMDDILTNDIRGERLREIQKYQMDIQANIRAGMAGKTFRILVEKSKVHKGIKKWMGRSDCNRIIHFLPESEQASYEWHWVDVKVTSATGLSAQAELVQDLGKLRQ
jgi:tRNA-2-methylthio-N6-dimethylallyladenosine synthase